MTMNLPADFVQNMQDADLSIPDRSALEHSENLCRRIREVIKNHGGNVSFTRYMEMALYEPGLGYYSSGAEKFGAAGDFVTAPDLSPLFALCLARQCQHLGARTLSIEEFIGFIMKKPTLKGEEKPSRKMGSHELERWLAIFEKKLKSD